ncbi:MAG: phage virion morphogenesis protein [Sulfolobales archaeon]
MEIRITIVSFPKIPDPQFFQKIAGITQRWIITKMRAGKTFYGEPMEPLKDITILSRRRKSRIPLNDTGRLGQSIQVYPISSGIVMRSSVIYAKTHQFGAIIQPKRAKSLIIPINPAGRYWGKVKGAKFIFVKRVVIPPRPFFPTPDRGLPPELTKIWLKVI